MYAAAILNLPANDPRRAAYVLAILQGTALESIGLRDHASTWETIRACLSEVAEQIVRPESGPADIAADILKAAGLFAGIERRHAELCVSQIAAGIAAGFGGPDTSAYNIAYRAREIYTEVCKPLAEVLK